MLRKTSRMSIGRLLEQTDSLRVWQSLAEISDEKTNIYVCLPITSSESCFHLEISIEIYILKSLIDAKILAMQKTLVSFFNNFAANIYLITSTIEKLDR